jgi:homogentisate 1,2-dioxygenase
MVMENTFRPPWFHRNTMTEYMGMIWGEYDAKAQGKDNGGGGLRNQAEQKHPKGFFPGGGSLHSCMMPHGPDAATFDKASEAVLKPEFFDKGLAFMFETSYMLKLSEWSLYGPHREADYHECWADLPSKFDPKAVPSADAPNHIMAWRAGAASKSKL